MQERYRSNSLDSILVADLNARAKATAAANVRNSALVEPVTRPVASPPASSPPRRQQLGNPELLPAAHNNHFLKNPASASSGKSSGLEKRPTFDALDKRKSWSVDPRSASAQQLTMAPVSANAGSGGAPAAASNPAPGQLRNARGQTLQQVQQGKARQQLQVNSKG